jgi:uncharacterized RDD family membrane protein YckC
VVSLPALHHAYAGLVSRLGALILDAALLMVATLAVGVLPGLAWNQIFVRSAPGWLTIGAVVIAGLLPWAYFTGCWWFTGQTVGDLLVGVVVRHRDGHTVSLPQAGARALFGLLLAPVWIVGMLAVLWDNRRRAWHDRVFRTVVPYAVAARAANDAQ